MRISDWSSDVCSSDLPAVTPGDARTQHRQYLRVSGMERANLAAFYSDYKDLQIQTFVNGVQNFENAGKVRIWGVEGEFTAVPIDGLTIDANFGYTNVKYKEYLQNGVDVSEIVKVIYTPKWTARLGGQYDFAELSNGGTLFVALDSRYRSGTPLTAFVTGKPE